MHTIHINGSFARCSCPSWNSSSGESALRSALASLDDCNSSLHWWLGFWTFWVALGVLLEVVFVVWEYLDELHDFSRGIVHPPERPQTILFVLGFLGAGLVAAGVSGEFWEESQIAKVETCIRKGNDALFFLLSKEAGDAARSAKDAEESALRAKTLAEETAEYAAWRTISDKQAGVIRMRIRFLKGHTLVIFANPHDAETSEFSSRLASILDSGIMEVKFGLWPTGWVQPPWLTFSIGKNRQADFDILVKALNAAGVDRADLLRKRSGPTGGDNDLELTIGARH